jgi:hypothetical protein
MPAFLINTPILPKLSIVDSTRETTSEELHTSHFNPNTRVGGILVETLSAPAADLTSSTVLTMSY